MTLTPAQAVDAANEAFGVHPRRRALHAKGTLLRGTFTASPQARELTRAAHMQGEPVPATVRVSNGAGNPELPDYAPDVRGLAVKLYLQDGSRTDLVTQSAPRFPVRTPEAFIELIRAQIRTPAMAWRLPLFLARHPRAAALLPTNLPALAPPESYAAIPYHGVHAFRFIDANGGSRYVRFSFIPEQEAKLLNPRAARQRGRDYLQEDIRRRIADGGVRFTLRLQVAEPGDNIDDPSAAWPVQRRQVDAGTLEVTELETEREQGDDILVFDPTRVTDGIECSEDPVLRFRRRAYDESVKRRSAG